MKNNLEKVLKVFSLMWLITGVGFLIGFIIPPLFMLPIGILGLVILIVSYFTKRDSKLSKGLVLTVPFLLGITSNLVFSFYMAELGAALFTITVLTAVILFIVMGMFGYQYQKDLSWMGKILFFALLGLIVFTVITIFTGASHLILAIGASVGVLIFLGFTMYDFNQIAQHGVPDDEVYHTAFGLYIDLLNLIYEMLKLVYHLKKLMED